MRRCVLFLFRRAPAIAILSLSLISFEATAQADVTITTVGTPLFLPTDFHMFAAPVGTAADGYAEFGQTMQAILPPPNHLSDPVLAIVPGDRTLARTITRSARG